MKSLQEIAELDSEAQELLEAAGYFDVNSFRGLSLEEITNEVVKANQALEILEMDPTVGVVKQWLAPLSGEIGEFDDLAVSENETDLVSTRELLAASFAIPLSSAFVEKNEIDVSQLLDGRVRFLSDDVTVKTPEEDEVLTEEPVVAEGSEADLKELEMAENDENLSLNELDEVILEQINADEESLDLENLLSADEQSTSRKVHTNRMDARINKDKILTMDAFRMQGSRIEPLENIAADNLRRTTREKTNKGVDPNSKRYVRGILHKRVGGFIFSLFAYFTFILFVITGFAMPLLLLLDSEKFYWAMFSPLLAIVGVVIFFMFTGKASCPICNQKQFAPKNCHKHRDAHRWPLIGYMLPTALHAVLFKWFRCIFCGTPVRLKE